MATVSTAEPMPRCEFRTLRAHPRVNHPHPHIWGHPNPTSPTITNLRPGSQVGDITFASWSQSFLAKKSKNHMLLRQVPTFSSKKPATFPELSFMNSESGTKQCGSHGQRARGRIPRNSLGSEHHFLKQHLKINVNI